MKQTFTLLLILVLGLPLFSRAQTSTFIYTGSAQTYTVPAGVTSVTVDARGAHGGAGYVAYSRGGYGGRVVCSLAVTPLSVLNVYVGGTGGSGITCCAAGAAGYNGGGLGSAYAGGGGGASDIRVGGTALTDRVIVAGGGGGAGYWTTTGGERGGDGGGTAGEAGYIFGSHTYIWGGGLTAAAGGGGTSSGGGAAGYWSGFTLPGSAGSLGTGGAGYTFGFGGGGGGGYYGGGGGTELSGGGGGSSYTDGTLCTSVSHTQGYVTGNDTVFITVNCSAGVITGTLGICMGGTSTLNDTAGGGSGTWSSSNTAVATIGSTTGVVSSVSAGTTTITYSVSVYCGTVYSIATVTVNPLPATITGTTNVCVGSTTTLSSTSSGGTWSSGSTGVATVGSTTGVVTGIASGTSVITYTLPTGCLTTATVTVNPLPAGITGITTVCEGSSVTLSDVTLGGTWVSSATGVATVGSSTGVVTGIAGGTAVISYRLTATGCLKTTTVTVNPLPASITGFANICAGTTTTYSSTTAGGTWTSSNPTVASVGSTTGLITGNSGGTATITYTLPTGCLTTATINIFPAPAIITGLTNVCEGSTTTLSDATTGGTWSSSDASIASIGSITGIVTGVTSGTAIITYQLVTGCLTTATVTVNPLPAGISGATTLCVGSSTTLSSSGGGTWSSSSTSVATIGSTTGIVIGFAAGTSVISFTLPTGCAVTATVTVDPLPGPITGTLSACVGSTSLLADATVGGSWLSGSTGVATIGSATGLVTGVATGTSIITYKLSTGCAALASFTVSPSPAAIVGATSLCVGSAITLTDATTGGTWSSSNTAVGTIGATTGILTGITSGTTIVSYMIGTGCFRTTTITVNPLPAAISGSTGVCVSLTLTLTDASTGGTWSSGSTGVATVGSTTGIVTGVTGGTAVITYTLPTGCRTTTTITVGSSPGTITGPTGVCIGSSATLSIGTTGGTWSSGSTTIATIGSASGIASGASAGTTTITYSMGGSCRSTTSFTVFPFPATIGGPSSICLGSSVTLTDATTGGTWSSSNTNVTIGSATGIANGAAVGTSVITYTSAQGCTITRTESVNPLPSAIAGPTAVCVGSTITLANATTGGTWSSSSTTIATIGSLTGIVTGGTTGSAVITYTLPTSCITTTTVTVNSAPGAITGPSSVCVGATITLSNSVSGGVWTSSNTAVATIGSLTGIVTGITSGTTTISYSLGLGCIVTKTITVNPAVSATASATNICVGGPIVCGGSAGGTWSSSSGFISIGSATGSGTGISSGAGTITFTSSTGCLATIAVTVDPTPTAISGLSSLCSGSSITLSNSVPGGIWTSTNPAIASVGSASGIVIGNAVGTVTITYAISSCYATKSVTVNPGASISGSGVVCTGLSTTLTASISGGTWSDPAYTSIATVGATSGIVTGIIPGAAVITYTTPGGCVSTKTINVNTMPGVITGITSICVGASTTLSNSTTGGTWYSTSALVSVGSTSGVVTGITAGVAGITYSLGSGCVATTVVTVQPAGSFISGSSNACSGSSITLTASGTGTWTSSNATIATVGSTDGIVTGVSAGTVVISYIPSSGCPTSKSVTINPLPGPIMGSFSVCQGATATFTNSGGGTWSCSPTSVATIVASSGVAIGVGPGIATVTYTLPTGCFTTFSPFTITPRPSAITGPANVCVGATDILHDATSGGDWTSADPSVATIDISTGVITGMASGTVAISYTLGSGCSIFRTIVINPISPILGTDSVCVGQNISLNDTSLGGTWTSSNAAIASATTAMGGVGVIHGVTAGTVTITYTLPTGCFAIKSVRVLAAPPAITGTLNVCVGQVTLLHDAAGGGAWTSDHTGIATIGASSGAVSGITAGTATISYSISGCPATATVTVNPLPGTISGSPNVCIGTTTTLSDAGGGTWSSSAAAIATVDPTSGVVTGVTSGTATITYTLPTGCYTTFDVTVNPSPAPITGSTNICVTNTTTLYDATLGGTWSSSNISIAPVDAFGTVSGLAVGSATISYTASTGCVATTTVAVNSLPSAISGPANVCEGSTITLTDASAGGSWSSSFTATADVSSASGIVTGIAAGTTTITYSLGAGCIALKNIVVNPLPAPITGTTSVCEGQTTYLFDATGTGTWSSGTTSVATINTSGMVSGLLAGTTVISYTLPTSCAVNITVTVNPAPAAIRGTTNICLGSTALLTNSVSGGTWISTDPAVASIGSATGLVTSLSLGATTIVYTLAAGCSITKNVYVVPLPGLYTVTGGGNFCAGGTGVHVRLTGSAIGVNYLLYNGTSVATGPIAGTGAALDFGLQTVAGMYTVVAVSTASSCSRLMTGSALIIVNPSVTPSVDISTGIGDTVCAGTLTTFTPVPTNGGSSPVYVWNINGTDVATSGSYSYTPANGDLVKVTMTSNANCAVPPTASHTTTMTVWAQQLPTVSALLAPKDTVCQGNAVTLTAIPEYGGATPSFIWTVNGGMAATGSTYTYAPANGDVVAVALTSNYPCRLATTANSNPVTLTVIDPLLPLVQITGTPGLSINKGQWDTLHAVLLNDVTAPTYQWFKNGIPLVGETSNTYISNEFSSLGSDSLTCQVTDHGQCTMTGFGWTYITVGTTGVQPVAAGNSLLTVLPNPNKGEFTIKGSLGATDNQVMIELTDMLGQIVLREQVRTTNGRIDHPMQVSGIANGMYLLNVRTDKESTVFHVVIEQ